MTGIQQQTNTFQDSDKRTRTAYLATSSANVGIASSGTEHCIINLVAQKSKPLSNYQYSLI